MTEKNKKLSKKLQEKIRKADRSGPPFNPVIKESKPPKPVAKPTPPVKTNKPFRGLAPLPVKTNEPYRQGVASPEDVRRGKYLAKPK